MNVQSFEGFTFAEVLIGIVLFGLFAATLFPALTALDKLQQAGRQRGRQVELVSVQEQLMARGLNPATVELARSPAIAGVSAPSYGIDRSVWLAREGRVSVWKIQGEARIAQPMLAYGFQLGAGINSPARGAVSPPLPPIALAEPTLVPAGPLLDVFAFSIPPAIAGAPWSIQLSATGGPGARVKIKFMGVRPLGGEGISSAIVELSASEVALGGTVETWAEYAGSAADTSETLSDGRTRWWSSSGGAAQLYEPSEKHVQRYRIDVGAPVLTLDTETFSSESVVPVDSVLRRAASLGRAQIHFLDDVNAKFGAGALPWSYDVAFEAAPGPLSGDVSGFFSNEALSAWTDSSSLTAKPLGGPAGLATTPGVWHFSISSTKLGPPELAATYTDDLSEGGPQTLLAPLLDGARVGRVRSGEFESTGPTLTVSLAPN